MKAVNLKICKQALLFLISGTISLTTIGCSKTNNSEIALEERVVTNIDDDKTTNDVKTTEEKLDKPVYNYPDNTYGFVKNNISLRKDSNKKSKKLARLEKFEKVKLISKSEGWTLVKYNGKKGYIKSKKVKKILDEFIDIDISEQKLRYYDSDGNIIVKSDVVTGRNNKTGKGNFKVKIKNTNRDLNGPGYSSYVNYFIVFDIKREIGLHDADGWRSAYGGDIYKTNGSHGCVNMPYKKVKKVYKKAKIGTRVLVHK